MSLLLILFASIAAADAPKPVFSEQAPKPAFSDHCPVPAFAPKPVFRDPPIKAPTISVPVEARGHWETQRQCGESGCSLQRVWVPGVLADPLQSIKPEEPKEAAEPQQRGHYERRGLFGRRVWVE